MVTWRSKTQRVVSRSSADAEFRSMAQGLCEVLWLKKGMEDLKRITNFLMKLYCDNNAAIGIVHNHDLHDRTKHIAIDKHFIKEKLKEGVICPPFVPRAFQVANV